MSKLVYKNFKVWFINGAVITGEKKMETERKIGYEWPCSENQKFKAHKSWHCAWKAVRGKVIIIIWLSKDGDEKDRIEDKMCCDVLDA